MTTSPEQTNGGDSAVNCGGWPGWAMITCMSMLG